MFPFVCASYVPLPFSSFKEARRFVDVVYWFVSKRKQFNARGKDDIPAMLASWSSVLMRWWRGIVGSASSRRARIPQWRSASSSSSSAASHAAWIELYSFVKLSLMRSALIFGTVVQASGEYCGDDVLKMSIEFDGMVNCRLERCFLERADEDERGHVMEFDA
jgi:hypothetical protein